MEAREEQRGNQSESIIAFSVEKLIHLTCKCTCAAVVQLFSAFWKYTQEVKVNGQNILKEGSSSYSLQWAIIKPKGMYLEYLE